MIALQNLTQLLEEEAKRFTYFGIFFDGKLVCVTKSRVYLQAGRAKSELISQNSYSLMKGLVSDPTLNYTQTQEDRRKQVLEAINELIKQGRLEIKQI